jgi:ribosomal protein L28
MSKKAYHRTHCKVCGDEITDGTQFSTCKQHRRGWNKRELTTCPCGQPAENIRSKYCGEVCRKKWGIKPPVKTITHTCLGCGKDFERPHFYPGKKNYCSNKCSHSQQKKVRDKFILNLNEHAVVFHSGWEIRFWAACLRFNIPIRSYDGPDLITAVGTYRPDFIVHDSLVVDVKGWLRPESAEKISKATVLMIDKEALLAFEADGCFPCVRPTDRLE